MPGATLWVAAQRAVSNGRQAEVGPAAQGTVAAVPCKDAVRDYGSTAAVGPTDRGARQVIHAKHRDWVTQVCCLLLSGREPLGGFVQHRTGLMRTCSCQGGMQLSRGCSMVSKRTDRCRGRAGI